MKKKEIARLKGLQKFLIVVSIAALVITVLSYESSTILEPTHPLFTHYLLGMMKTFAASVVSVLFVIFIEIRLDRVLRNDEVEHSKQPTKSEE